MSRRSKGSGYEKEVQKLLESEGWIVERATPKIIRLPGGRVFTTSHDFFGAWDICAKKAGYKTLWVQVSTWEHVSDKRKQVALFPWTSDFDEPCIYARIKGKKGHFRVLYAKHDYEWFGHVEQ